MKRNAIARIIIYSVLIVILLIALIAGISVDLFTFRTSKAFHGETVTNGTQLIADKIENISIDWASGNITVEPADIDCIQVSENAPENNKYPMIVKQNGRNLKIQFCESGWETGINLSVPSKDLTILVPRNWDCNSLEIDAASAKANISGLTICDVDIDTASGEYTFLNCDVVSVDMDSASGGLRFNGTLQNLDFDGASADAELVLSNAPKNLNMDSVSGTMDITLPEGAGFTLKKETLSGNFSCDFPTEAKGDRITYGDGSCRIDMSGVSGNIHIRKTS